MRVEIVYAQAGNIFRQLLELSDHTTVQDAIARSSLIESHPEIDFNFNKIGIYGKLVSASAELKDNDRIEIYRPLLTKKKQK